MSAQFGRWNYDGEAPAQRLFEKVQSQLSPYGPDGSTYYSRDGAGIVFCAFHATQESRGEKQPHLSPSGTVITWDGRLDNRAELIRSMSGALGPESADGEIAVAAYERWGTECFARLIGDWALSAWSPGDRMLLLAKDPVGTRHLYYLLEPRRVTWSTNLEPLVVLAERRWELEEEYIAACLSFFPATHLTPYAGIHSVPPSSLVQIRAGRETLHRYWDFNPAFKIRYNRDRDYEEHFRMVFRESVRRRLRSDGPVLAELSGGMDSSAIVCAADQLIASSAADTQRLDTVSYYDDSEPNWDERPYFTKVEEQRGRAGLHIDVGLENNSTPELEADSLRISPGSEGPPSQARKKLNTFLILNGHRVLLSGFGGDEVLGGVPDPTSELADLLAEGKIRKLAKQLKAWALHQRRPWLHLLWGAACRFFPVALVGVPRHLRPAPWLAPAFVSRHRTALTGYMSRLELVGPLPTFQENLATLEALRRQLGCDAPPQSPVYEKRYPCLDRDLLEFLFAIPREQLVRPGQRRSLMRRALVGLVPDELLGRRRKAFVARNSVLRIAQQWSTLVATENRLVMASLGFVDAGSLCAELERARVGKEALPVALIRTLGIEMWLRNLARCGLLSSGSADRGSLHRRAKECTVSPS